MSEPLLRSDGQPYRSSSVAPEVARRSNGILGETLAHAPMLQGDLEDEDAEWAATTFYWYEGALYPAHSADTAIQDRGKPFCSTSFGMPADHPIRTACIGFVCNARVNNFILVVIMSNCVWMLFEASPLEPGTPAAARSAAVEWLCMGIFSIELVTKVVAHGLLLHDTAYLHDAWNWLDVAVVVPFWVFIFIPDSPSFASLQLARALRPLRSIRSFPELRRTVVAFLKAGPALSSVVGLTVFFFLVFGIVGVELYEGALHHRCAPPAAVNASDLDLSPAEWQAARGALRGPHQSHRALKGGGGGEVTHYCNVNTTMCLETSPGLSCFNFVRNPPYFGSLDSMRDAAIIILQVCTPTPNPNPNPTLARSTRCEMPRPSSYR
jgi:hypothetical protein